MTRTAVAGAIVAGLALFAAGASNTAGDSLNSTSYNFIWSDASIVAHNDDDSGSDDWTNGLYVKTIPTGAQTLTN